MWLCSLPSLPLYYECYFLTLFVLHSTKSFEHMQIFRLALSMIILHRGWAELWAWARNYLPLHHCIYIYYYTSPISDNSALFLLQKRALGLIYINSANHDRQRKISTAFALFSLTYFDLTSPLTCSSLQQSTFPYPNPLHL